MTEQLLIHGHSCCEFRTPSSSLLCDPWLVGSAYWRSWWNFPQNSDISTLIDEWNSRGQLYIYISHIHWDHFHAPSLRRIFREVSNIVFLLPKTIERRLYDDLRQVLGVSANIIELDHAVPTRISEEITLVSYQNGLVITDSALLVKLSSAVILNLNDTKIGASSMKHLRSFFGSPDIVLRSHSSANSRCCIRGLRGERFDSDKDRLTYSKEFFEACYNTQASIAIPFASNMTCLHDETFEYNSILNFADYVVRDFNLRRQEYSGMECLMLLPSESLDLNTKKISRYNKLSREWLASLDRTILLESYRKQVSPTLLRQHEKEKASTPSVDSLDRYMRRAFTYAPLLFRYILGSHITIAYRSDNGGGVRYFELDFIKKAIREYSEFKDSPNSVYIYASSYVLNDVFRKANWNSLGVSKRLVVRMNPGNLRYFVLGVVLNNIESNGLLIPSVLLSPRTFRIAFKRRREFLDCIKTTFYFVKNRIP